MMAMMPSVETIMKLAQLPNRTEEGILCASDNFAGIIRKTCSGMGSWSEVMPARLFGSADLEEFLKGKDALIVPKNHEVFASANERRMLQTFEDQGGKIIPYDYTIDRGSFLYVEGLIKKTMNAKRSI